MQSIQQSSSRALFVSKLLEDACRQYKVYVEKEEDRI